MAGNNEQSATLTGTPGAASPAWTENARELTKKPRPPRRKKDPERLLSVNLKVRLSAAEAAAVTAAAASAGVSVSAYARAGLLNVPIVQKRTFDAVTLHDLARVGSNINQIAHKLNAGGSVPPARLDSALADLLALIEQMRGG